jgi:hypothetical protein
MGQYVEKLLSDNKYYGTLLPRIPVPVEREHKKKLMLRGVLRTRQEENELYRDRLKPGMRIKTAYEDGKFYEAEINETLDNGNFVVTFTEYGNQVGNARARGSCGGRGARVRGGGVMDPQIRAWHHASSRGAECGRRVLLPVLWPVYLGCTRAAAARSLICTARRACRPARGARNFGSPERAAQEEVHIGYFEIPDEFKQRRPKTNKKDDEKPSRSGDGAAADKDKGRDKKSRSRSPDHRSKRRSHSRKRSSSRDRKSKRHSSRSRSRSHRRSRGRRSHSRDRKERRSSRDRKSSRDRDRKGSRERERKSSRERERKSSRERERKSSRERERKNSRSRSREDRRSGSPVPQRSPPAGDGIDLDSMLNQKMREEAVASGKDYARRPTSYKQALTIKLATATGRKRSR